MPRAVRYSLMCLPSSTSFPSLIQGCHDGCHFTIKRLWRRGSFAEISLQKVFDRTMNRGYENGISCWHRALKVRREERGGGGGERRESGYALSSTCTLRHGVSALSSARASLHGCSLVVSSARASLRGCGLVGERCVNARSPRVPIAAGRRQGGIARACVSHRLARIRLSFAKTNRIRTCGCNREKKGRGGGSSPRARWACSCSAGRHGRGTARRRAR